MKNAHIGAAIPDQLLELLHAKAHADNAHIINRQIYSIWMRTSKNGKMAKKWRDAPIYGRATPYIRHYHVVFGVPVLMLSSSNKLVQKRARTFFNVLPNKLQVNSKS